MALQETLKALSDPVRRKILVSLREKELSAGEIAQVFADDPARDLASSAKTKICGACFGAKREKLYFL